MSRPWGAVLCLMAFLLLGSSAAGEMYQPPGIRGHVTDMADKLRPNEVAALNEKLASYRKCSSNHVAVYIAVSLDGHSIEDVAYVTFNTWNLGTAEKDNGVLLVIAPRERRNFIATGKGVGGSLTDVAAFNILRDKVSPRLKEDKFLQAVDDGTTAIAAALGGCEMPLVAPALPLPAPPSPRPWHAFVRIAMGLAVAVLAFLVLLALRASPSIRLIVAGIAGASFGAVTFFFDTAGVFDLHRVANIFTLAGVVLIFANAVVWLRRLKMSANARPGVIGESSGASDYAGSSHASSSDSGYSGGGGSTGGGGAGDSW